MKLIVMLLFCLTWAWSARAQNPFETDTFETSAGTLSMTFIGHGTLMMRLEDSPVVHVDPWSSLADYSTLPKADLILITHGHGDHFDPDAVETLSTDDTVVVCPPSMADQLDNPAVMANGGTAVHEGLTIEAVPAYNIEHMRSAGVPYHPKGEGNGYVIEFGGTRVYVAGDTENIPEMDSVEDIDIAFLPVNLPYTMTPEMAADAAQRINPDILYPYHYGDTDLTKLTGLLEDSGIDVRIRDMQ